MNKKVCELLKILIHQNSQPHRMDELAKTLDVTERSVRNYWKEVEAFFSPEEMARYFEVDGAAFRYIGSDKDTAEVAERINSTNFYEYKLSGSERRELIELLLLSTDRPVTLQQMETSFYAGRGTLMRDLEQVENELRKMGTALKEKRNTGYVIECDELSRRDAMLAVLQKINPVTHPMDMAYQLDPRVGFVRQLLKLEKYGEKAEGAIRDGERAFHLVMSDYDFYYIKSVLCLHLLRCEAGQLVNPPPKLHYSKNGWSINLATYTLKQLDASCREEEIQYLAEKLHTIHWLEGEDPHREMNINFQIIVRSFLYRLSLAYQRDLLADTKLQQYLTGHIFGVYHRMADGQQLENPFTQSLLQDYPSDYAILREHITVLEEGLGHHFSDDEITYVLMHILAALARIAETQPPPDVIIACNTGLGTANFLAETIRRKCNVNIVSITSTHSVLPLLERQPCDLVITTVPLPEVPVAWVQVNAVPTGADLENISMALAKKKKPELSASYALPPSRHAGAAPPKQGDAEAVLHFSDLLLEGHILLDKKAEDWREAIITAGEPLLWSNKVGVDYLGAMVDNVLENGPYIVIAPGIALAHASPSAGVLEIGASLMRLSAPVSFGHAQNDPVHFVVALSMQDSAQHVQALLSIMNTICNPHAVRLLLQAKTEGAVLDIIRSYEDIDWMSRE